MTKTELKNAYKNQYELVKNLINKFDPCGLIQAGAPDDEYDCLTTELISLVFKGTTIERIKKLIVDEMRDHFGVDLPTKEPYLSKFDNDLNEFAKSVRALAGRI